MEDEIISHDGCDGLNITSIYHHNNNVQKKTKLKIETVGTGLEGKEREDGRRKNHTHMVLFMI